jgi:predicted Zn-dependent peptidase
MIKGRETSLKTNAFWRAILPDMWLQNEDLKTISGYEERVNKVTSQDIADFLKKYFDVEHYVRVNTFPEK